MGVCLLEAHLLPRCAGDLVPQSSGPGESPAFPLGLGYVFGVFDERGELPARDLAYAHVEIPADGDLALWAFPLVARAVPLAGRRAHSELPGRDLHQLHGFRVEQFDGDVFKFGLWILRPQRIGEHRQHNHRQQQ